MLIDFCLINKVKAITYYFPILRYSFTKASNGAAFIPDVPAVDVCC